MTAGCERENAAGRRQVEKVAQHDQARQTAAVVATLRHRRTHGRGRPVEEQHRTAGGVLAHAAPHPGQPG